jgi:BirA family biotin operon repressor/biotin-[acetyl-CoA-carboxylase] ligase
MPARSNIAMSLTWPFDISDSKFPLLPLTVAVAIVETLSQLSIRGVQIKWPNDVYVNGEKIAGILIETQKMQNKSEAPGAPVDHAVIIGIGLNYDLNIDADVVNRSSFLGSGRVTDIISAAERLEIQPPGLAVVAESLLSRVVNACQRFDTQAGVALEAFRRHYDFCCGKQVQVQLDKDVLDGVARGVSDTAELLVLVDDELRCFNSADISVKPQPSVTAGGNNNS